MAATPTEWIPLGFEAPDFLLPEPATGAFWSPAQLKGPNGLAIAFICNHCPYVIHMIDQWVAIAKKYQEKGIGFVAISANDVEKYPQDAPDAMVTFAQKHGFTFPYLYDETQEVALAYFAACTPDLAVFDAQNKCVYRGQFDGSRPQNDVPVSGQDLALALDALLTHAPPLPNQIPSIGCNIKWKPEKAPSYFIPKPKS
jgi:peroxiredoxin